MLPVALILLLSMSMEPGAVQSLRLVTFEVRVTDRTGTPIEGARVTAEGPTIGREGQTTSQGTVTFRNVAAGVYRFRVEREGFITLEKETVARVGTVASVEATLS